MNDPVLVQIAQQAITIVMWENEVDADTAAEVIRDRASAHRITIKEMTQAIVTVAATSGADRPLAV